MERLSNSMHRLHMPGADFNREELIKCIGELVKLDKDWIPSGEGFSLYLRPTVIATHRFLGLAAPDSILLYVITCPVGPYYKTGFKPIKVRLEQNRTRTNTFFGLGAFLRLYVLTVVSFHLHSLQLSVDVRYSTRSCMAGRNR
jgi:branched-subunit amino acid aminotransferase/4-amino-4-deoxychorismate lyase